MDRLLNRYNYPHAMVKPIYILFIMMVFSSCNNVKEKPEIQSFSDSGNGKAVITFTSYEHDFGKIAEGEKVGCIFKFTNTGTSDLVVASASSSCGCTVPKYDVKPISPGKSGTLEVMFDATGRSGIQTKTVTVKSNADVPVVILKITADVVEI